MKVIIRVWEADKPHKASEGMPQTTILEYDKFDNPEIIGHNVPIERCQYDKYDDLLNIWLDEFPARLDADPGFSTIHLMANKWVQFYSEAYTILDADKGKGIILWTNPNKIKAEVS